MRERQSEAYAMVITSAKTLKSRRVYGLHQKLRNSFEKSVAKTYLQHIRLSMLEKGINAYRPGGVVSLGSQTS